MTCKRIWNEIILNTKSHIQHILDIMISIDICKYLVVTSAYTYKYLQHLWHFCKIRVPVKKKKWKMKVLERIGINWYMWHVIYKRPNVTFNTTNLKPSQAFLTFRKSLLNVQSCSNHIITHFHKHQIDTCIFFISWDQLNVFKSNGMCKTQS